MKFFYPTLVSFLLMIFITPAVAQTKAIPFQELPTAGGSPSGSGIFFGATMSAASITVNFSGPSDRWIAFGLGTTMYPADVFIYSNGKTGFTHPLGWNDYYNSSGGGPGVNNDAVQNWTVLSTGTVSPGQRTVTATRALNTGDLNDVAITFSNNALDLIWAHGASADYTIAYHGSNNRAYWISLPWLVAPTASFVSSTTVCAGSSMVYTNTSVGGQTSYTWAFSGGSPATSTLTNPTVTYAAPGIYSVSLIAANAIGSDTVTQINYITVTPTIAPSLSIVLSSGSNPMCSASPVTFSAVALNGGNNPTFQWKVNGINAGTNNPLFTTLTLTNSAAVTCVLTSNAACASPPTYTSSAISMSVNSTAAASLSTSIVSGSNPLCIGALVGFTAVPGNGGSAPFYQWQINSSNVGSNSPSFTTATLANGDVVSCLLISNAPCASNTLGLAPGITMTVSSTLVPGVSISSSNNPICAGALVSVTATPFNGGNLPLFQWFVNGNAVGVSGPVYTTTTLSNGNVISCQMSSALQCAIPSTVVSSGVNFTVNPIPPAPTISTSGPLSFCAGNTLTLTSSAASGNLWSGGSTAQTVIAVTTSTYAVTQMLNGCVSPVSSIISTTVHPLPTASLLPLAPLCKNAPLVQLEGEPFGGSYSGPGVVGDLFNAAAITGSNATIIYQYQDNNNCVDTAAIQIVVDECLGLFQGKKKSPKVTVYPNPSAGVFMVNSEAGLIRSVRVFDITGTCVLDVSAVDAWNGLLDLRSYANGVYVLDVKVEKTSIKIRIHKNE